MSRVLFLTIIRAFLIHEYTGKGFEPGQNTPVKVPNSCTFTGLEIPVIVPWYIDFYQNRVDFQQI